MNPQLNKIFSKLAKEDKKTELASQKIELNLITRLEEFEYELSRSTADFAQLVNDFTTKAKKEKQRIEKVLKTAKSQADDAVKKIKELGLNPNDLPVNKKLRNTIKDSESFLKSTKF
jgi:Asp-tRNA(Asn)/Glu-tRNA(Gln) amidotransferase B subunit